MENNKEKNDAYIRSAKEVENLQNIFKDLLGIDVDFIPKFRKDKETLEAQMLLSSLRKKEALDKENQDLKAAQLKLSNIGKGINAIQTSITGKENKGNIEKDASKDLYKIIFTYREQAPIIITKAMYENLYSYPVDTHGMLHGEDGKEKMSVRASDIRAVIKV